MTLGSESDLCFVSSIEYLTIKAVNSSEARSKYEAERPRPQTVGAICVEGSF